MSLQQLWLAFCKKHIDKWMLEFQRDDSVSFADWKELQAAYETLYGKHYDRAEEIKEQLGVEK